MRGVSPERRSRSKNARIKARLPLLLPLPPRVTDLAQPPTGLAGAWRGYRFTIPKATYQSSNMTLTNPV